MISWDTGIVYDHFANTCNLTLVIETAAAIIDHHKQYMWHGPIRHKGDIQQKKKKEKIGTNCLYLSGSLNIEHNWIRQLSQCISHSLSLQLYHRESPPSPHFRHSPSSPPSLAILTTFATHL